MKKALKYLSYTGLLALALPAQAASVITGNNSFVEGYIYVEDTLGNSVLEGGASYSPPSVYATDFWDDQGGAFDGYNFPVFNASDGWAGGGQNSVYDVDHIYGDGIAGAEVSDPNNELSLIQLSGESLVDITFEVLTDYTYTLTGDLFANALGRVDLFFDGNTASESDGIFSFSGYLAAGSYNLTIDALAAIDGSQLATSGFNYDLQLTEVSAIPLPAAVWLFGSGLIGLIGLARRKTHS